MYLNLYYRGYHVTKKIWLEPIRMKAFVIDKPKPGRNMIVDNNALVMFHDGAFELDVRISASENTVWLILIRLLLSFRRTNRQSPGI